MSRHDQPSPRRGCVRLTITVSEQSKAVLDALVRRGVYGTSAEAIAARFVDAALQQFVEAPKVKLP